MANLIVLLMSKFTYVALILFIISLAAFSRGEAQSERSFGLQRSQSETRFNRNNTSFRRQSSYRDSCNTNYKFDYIQLTLMWAPGSCSTSPQECKRESNKHFTVHGMWPTIKGTQEPHSCCFDNTFDYKALDSILPDLNEYWYSYYEVSNNRHFWSHEWLKHGTCSRDVKALRGELNYFGTTVKLAKDIPLLETLNKANIVPDNGKPYNSADINKALSPLSKGKTIQIQCDYEHHQQIPVLTGVNFCYDSNLEPADCPPTRPKCQRQIYFLSSSSRPTSGNVRQFFH